MIVGYFLDGHTSGELARFLGVTESRISQLRSEALEMLKTGIEAQYEPTVEGGPTHRRVGVRLSERRAEYAAAIAEASPWQSRLDRPPSLLRQT